MKKNNENPLLTWMKTYSNKTEKEVQAENDWYDGVFEMVGDRPLEDLKKAELIEYARSLEMKIDEISCAFDACRYLADAAETYSEVVNDEHCETQSNHRKGAETTNEANRKFWHEWRMRYSELRNDGVKIMNARRTVRKEIIASGGKKYAVDGALKKQLKE